MTTMGERIRQRRKQLGLSAAQLAKKALCSKSFISKIENDQRKPSVRTLLRLCQALACASIDILTEDTENDTPSAHQRD